MKIFYLPDLGEGLAEAEIREWYVKPGDTVEVDQPLASMETAKAVVDVPSPYAGKIQQLHGHANDIIKTGSPLVTYEMDEAVMDQGSVVGKLETSEKKWDESEVIIGKGKAAPAAIKAMPAARVLANQFNINLTEVQPTGPQGLITAEDVKKHVNKGQQSVTHVGGQAESLRGVRRVMAQTMTKSHQEIVPVTIVEDVDITELPPKTDLTVKLLQAMGLAVKAEPALNAWFDGKLLERKLFDEMHVGLAVDSTEGLFVPVIRKVENLTETALREAIDNCKQAVQTRTISPGDLQGATIMLSNFGTIAGRYATPVIVPPMVAILGAGRSRAVAVVRDGQLVPGKILPLSLTFDHRAVTGGEATRFLASVMKYLTQA